MKTNKIAFILNAHLPYVRHIEYPRFLEEDWLFEAINESYLPLLRMLSKLKDEKLSFKFTISMSPPLCCMLTDEALQQRFIQYMKRHVELGEKEVERTVSDDPRLHEMAVWYLTNYRRNLDDFENYNHNILTGFKNLEDMGVIEIITTCATHAYLPLYQEYPTAVDAQIEMGIQSHLCNFGHISRGFWLPECGYYPSLEEHLKSKGITWFQTASQSMLLSPDKVEYGTFQPVRCPNGVVAFPRDYEATSLIWSNTNGYPCDARYREFYRDIGYDLPLSYIGPYVEEDGNRVFTGYKYWSITGEGQEKKLYDRAAAQKVVESHAANFLFNISSKAEHIVHATGKMPLSTLGFDCELFGHWWFEGIDWLEQVIRQSCKEDCTVQLTTPTQFLETKPQLQVARPAYSSWGIGGYSSTWLDGSNAWIYRHIHQALARMEELAIRFPQQISLKRRFLNQAAREVLLAMGSDWPFIMYNKTSGAYAQRRLEEHLENFNVVYSNMCKNAVNTEWLMKAEKKDVIFKDIDYNIFNPSNT
ncbi:MAG: 1,4-alpha-glucan branching protein domain-containing protein [Sphaerochaetaceae bacterium]